MTELYIDGKKAVLDKSTSLTLIEENPWYTKGGIYTLDVVLSLEHPTNVRIYEHQNRDNKADRIEKKRSAIVIVDNQVVLNGIEDIRGWGDKSVTIQLKSGNAELNFLIGGDRRLRDLDMGSAIPFVPNVELGENPFINLAKQVFQSWKDSYPVRNWHLLPYYTGEPSKSLPNDDMTLIHPSGNFVDLVQWNPDNLSDDDPNRWGYDAQYNPYYSGQVPQPYLCFIIEEVLKSLGYTLIYNAIATHEIFKNAYIVHGFRTMEFAKMLPSWTVNEFFSKIELQFDCTFLVNHDDRSVRLLFNYQKYKDDEVTTLNVIDEYETETDEENVLDVRSANIAYSLDSDEYYKYMDINPLFRKIAHIQGYSGITTLLILMRTDDPDKFKTIYVDIDTGDRFIAYDTGKVIDGKPQIIPRRVDSFAPLYNNAESTEIDMQFDIIPASMIIERRSISQILFEWVWSQMATAGDFDALRLDGVEGQDPLENFNLQSLIEGDTSLAEETTYSKMRLAIYPGLSTLDTLYRRARYPISYVESLAEYFEETSIERYFGPKGANPFRLKNLNADIYSKTKNIDTTLIYNRTFLDTEKINISSKFIIKNKSFVCKKIERTITIDGFDDEAEGEFYPINE